MLLRWWGSVGRRLIEHAPLQGMALRLVSRALMWLVLERIGIVEGMIVG